MKRWAVVLVFRHEVGSATLPLRTFWTKRAAEASFLYHSEFVDRHFPGGSIIVDIRRSRTL